MRNYYTRQNTDFPLVNIISLIIGIFLILYFIIAKTNRKGLANKRKYSNNSNNPKAVSAIAQSIGANYKESFNQAIKDIEKIDSLCYFFDPKFKNVLEIENEDGCKIYIGDLEWSIRHGKKAVDGTYSDYNSLYGNNDSENKYKQFTTLCVCYNNSFNLPHFNLTKETLEKRASELLKIEETEDIDFVEDKEFSDAWWLASNENVLVRDLFDKKVRKTFMSFVDRDYIICGQQNCIIILAGKILNPNTYKYVISEMNKIQKAFIENGKFYKTVLNS